MKISQLEMFVSAVKNRSFSKAAKECFTVQSAISQQMTALEQELGFALFERSARGINLTPAGERYYSDTVQILEKLHENQKIASQIAEGMTGVLKVGITSSSQIAFINKLKAFRQENPALSIQYVYVNSELQPEELKEGMFDILHTAEFTMMGEEDKIGFADKKTSPLVVLMNEEHPLAAKENVTLQEFASWPNVYAGTPKNNLEGALEIDLFKGTEIKPIRNIIVSNQDIGTLLLCFNSAISVAPEEAITAMPRAVVSRPLENGRFTLDMGWAYLKENKNPALLRLLDFLEAK